MAGSGLDPARSAYHWIRKRSKRGYSYLAVAYLRQRNRHSADPVVGDGPAIVSLTTYGPRLATVADVIEAIGRGTVRPRRLILWLDDPEAYRSRPEALRRLESRGLEIRMTPDYGPHKKYFPALEHALSANLQLVTADDDVVYPRSWLRRLLAAAEQHPDAVNCYRANIVAMTPNGRIAPYGSWPRCLDTTTSITRFGTGVSGVRYPLAMLRELVAAGTAFMEICPKADDIWLHWIALRAGVGVRQIDPTPRHFPLLPGSQVESLMSENVALGRNDDYVADLYDDDDIRALAEAKAPVLTSK